MYTFLVGFGRSVEAGSFLLASQNEHHAGSTLFLCFASPLFCASSLSVSA
jgi:hypothetical protein